MLWKCCTQYATKFGKLNSAHRTGKGQFSFQFQRKVIPKNIQTTTQLHSSPMLAKQCSLPVTSNSLGFAPFAPVTFLQCLYPSSKRCYSQLSSTLPVLSSTATPPITMLRGMTRRSTENIRLLTSSDCWTPDLNLHLLNAHTWRRQWHPTPVLLPGKSHAWRSLVGCSPWGCSPWGCAESDTTERLSSNQHVSGGRGVRRQLVNNTPEPWEWL